MEHGNDVSITWKRRKIGCKLVLITNRKSHELSIGTKIGRAALSAVAELLVRRGVGQN